MNALIARMQSTLGPRAGVIAALGAPLAVLLVLAMMVLPLPPFVLDLLFTLDRKSTRLNSSHSDRSRMPSSA